MLSKRILVLVFVVAFLTLLVGCTSAPSNKIPILTSDPITVATVGVKYVYDVDATDPNDDTLTYSFIDKPEGMVINSTTGVINWVPSFSQMGDNPVVVKVSDGSLSIAQSFIIKVSAVELELIGIKVFPKTMTLIVGESRTITSVTARYSDGSTAFIALGSCTYASSNTNVAKVSNGKITAVAKGTAAITVSYKGEIDTLGVTVSKPEPEPEIELIGITVKPKTMNLVVGKFEAIESVTATYEIRGSKVPIALGKCTYKSDKDEVATVDEDGDVITVKAVAEGTAIITVGFGGETDTVAVTVSTAKVIGIEVSSDMIRFLETGDSKLFTVTAIYNDDSTPDITSDCIYGYDIKDIVTVDKEAGKITADNFGKAIITVTYISPGQESFTDIIEVGVGRVHMAILYLYLQECIMDS